MLKWSLLKKLRVVDLRQILIDKLLENLKNRLIVAARFYSLPILLSGINCKLCLENEPRVGIY